MWLLLVSSLIFKSSVWNRFSGHPNSTVNPDIPMLNMQKIKILNVILSFWNFNLDLIFCDLNSNYIIKLGLHFYKAPNPFYFPSLCWNFKSSLNIYSLTNPVLYGCYRHESLLVQLVYLVTRELLNGFKYKLNGNSKFNR